MNGICRICGNDGVETEDKISAMFISGNRPIIKVRGYLHTYKCGSDGEPLLLDAEEIK